MPDSPYVGGIAPAPPPAPPGQQQYDAMASAAGQDAAEAWKQSETLKLMHNGMTPGETAAYFGTDAGPKPGGPLADHVNGNLQPHADRVQTPMEAIAAGWNMSVPGLAWRAAHGDTNTVDQMKDQNVTNAVLSEGTQMVADLPATVVGWIGGGSAGASAGAAVPGAGETGGSELVGATAGAGFGGSAVPEGMRQALLAAMNR